MKATVEEAKVREEKETSGGEAHSSWVAVAERLIPLAHLTELKRKRVPHQDRGIPDMSWQFQAAGL